MKLVMFFSAEGTTAKVAKDLAAELGAEVFEIVPAEPYSKADIRWINPVARCNREKFGKKEVPSVGTVENFSEYDEVYLGFPIWYGCAPNVVNTFCKAYDWSGKKLTVFATSGGSGIGKTGEKLMPFVSGAELVKTVLVKTAADVLK